MSKRNNISYIKPQDPSFLKVLKEQIGYKEGPSIETKRQKLQEDGSGSDSCGEDREREDEKPTIVQVHSGDLTADEVAQEEDRIAREAATAPADLNQPIIFKKRAKATKESTTATPTPNPKKSKKKSKQSKSKLSFNDEDEEEQESDQ